MEDILEVLELRSEGIKLSDEEIRNRLGHNDPSAQMVADGRKPDEGFFISGSDVVIQVYGSLFQRANLFTRYSGGTSTQMLRSLLNRFGSDSKISRIILDIDSPGGQALGNQEIVDMVKDIAGSKEVVASVNGLAASAAYYIATAASRIVASPSSMIGSIGTLLIHKETSRMDDKNGVTFNVIKSGEFKADGNPHEALTEKSRASLLERVVVYHDQFVEAVADRRGVSESDVRTKFGDGKVFIASEAKQRGLIDEIGTLQQVLGSSQSTGSAQSRAATVTSKESDMDKRLKAALFARGIIGSMDATDEVCEAAMNAWFSARGQDVPESLEDRLGAINNFASIRIAHEYDRLAAPANAAPEGSGFNAATAEPAEQPLDAAQIAANERHRIGEINAIAAELGNVPDETVQQAIDDPNCTADMFSTRAIRARQPENDAPDLPVRPGEAQADRFAHCMEASLGLRLGLYEDDQEGEQQAINDSAELYNRRLVDIASQAITSMLGQRIPRNADDRDIAGAFLRIGGDDMWSVSNLEVGASTSGASNDPAYHGSGHYPNVLAALVGKILDRAMRFAPTTYSRWSGRLPDCPDFKPKPITAIGEFNRLPKHMLGRPFEASDVVEGISWVIVDSYGDEFVMTPDMIVNDDMDSFMQAARTKGAAHEFTVNDLVFNMLLSNPRTVDGGNMFRGDDTSDPNRTIYGNIVAPAGAPDSAAFSAMRLQHRRQLALGKQNKLGYDAAWVLAGSEWETQLEKTLDATLYPQVEADANRFRGRYTPIIDTVLDETPTPKRWWTGVSSSQLRGIIHIFQRGYGSGGRRRSYFRNETQCRHFQIEGRFGSAAVNHQAMMQNDGE